MSILHKYTLTAARRMFRGVVYTRGEFLTITPGTELDAKLSADSAWTRTLVKGQQTKAQQRATRVGAISQDANRLFGNLLRRLGDQAADVQRAPLQVRREFAQMLYDNPAAVSEAIDGATASEHLRAFADAEERRQAAAAAAEPEPKGDARGGPDVDPPEPTAEVPPLLLDAVEGDDAEA